MPATSNPKHLGRQGSPLPAHPSGMKQNLPTPPAIPHRVRTLDNGLVVVLSRRAGTGTAAVYVWYKVGAKDDPRGKSGFAHLFEHLMFKRTRNLPDEAIDRLTEDIGGENNAYTSPDVTVYHETIPANHLEVLLWAEAERMRNLLVTSKAFVSERDVVKEEYREGVLTPPYGRFFDTLERVSWNSHPYRNTVIGNIPELDAATLPDVREFHREHYRPDNAVLVVAGDFDDQQVDRWIDDTFGNIPPFPVRQPRSPATEPPRTAPRRHTVTGPAIALPAVALSYLVPPVTSADNAVLTLLDSILASGKASRLHRELVERRQLASDSASWIDLRTDAGLLCIRATAAQSVPVAKLEAAIEDVVEELRTKPVPIDELRRVRDRILTLELRSRETVAGIAGLLGDAMVFHGNPSWADSRWADIDAVTPEDIRDAANRYLIASNRTTVIAVKGKATPIPSSRPVPASAKDDPPVPPPDQKPPKPSRPAAPASVATAKTQLANGARVFQLGRPGSGLVSIELVFPCGISLDPQDRQGRSALLADVLNRGTRSKNSEQLAAAAESLGGTIATGASWDDLRIDITVPASRAPAALGLLSEMVRYPRLAASDIAKAKAERSDNAVIALEDPVTIANYALGRLIHGNLPPGQIGGGLPGTLARISRNELVALWAKALRPESAILVATGDISATQWFDAAKSALGDWPRSKQPIPTAPEIAAAPTRRPRVLFVAFPGAGQAVVTAGTPGLRRNDPDYASALLLNSILGGGFSARLNREIRIRRGLAYGAFSSIGADARPGSLTMSAQTRNEAAAEVALAMRNQLAGMVSRRPGADELEARRAALLGPMVRGMETGEGILSSLGALARLGLSPAELTELPKRIARIGADTIVDVARRRFPAENLRIVVVGDPESCRKPLRKAFPDMVEIQKQQLNLEHAHLGLPTINS